MSVPATHLLITPAGGRWQGININVSGKKEMGAQEKVIKISSHEVLLKNWNISHFPTTGELLDPSLNTMCISLNQHPSFAI